MLVSKCFFHSYFIRYKRYLISNADKDQHILPDLTLDQDMPRSGTVRCTPLRTRLNRRLSFNVLPVDYDFNPFRLVPSPFITRVLAMTLKLEPRYG
jgi:hypothetical protein